uniref:Uncharacterized protein n=1 Tax=Anguilla anguilla TaxID=7936 RepID=A0A0E9WL15_ANGAN
MCQSDKFVTGRDYVCLTHGRIRDNFQDLRSSILLFLNSAYKRNLYPPLKYKMNITVFQISAGCRGTGSCVK